MPGEHLKGLTGVKGLNQHIDLRSQDLKLSLYHGADLYSRALRPLNSNEVFANIKV